MPMTIPDDILGAAGMTEQELRQEIAVLLFLKDKLTLAQASRLADMTRLEFQHILANRHIPVHFGEDELAEDLRTLNDTGQG